jgi:hypothetical protein
VAVATAAVVAVTAAVVVGMAVATGNTKTMTA